MDRPIKFGSVCSGIEAASVAWMPLGWRAAWLSEIEPFPSAVLAHHYPDVPNLGDMTALPERIRSGEIEAPDVFCGGTPCQSFSLAGLRKSLDDARGNLSLTFCEIANAIDHVRAGRGDDECVVFWENVPGVLNTRDNAFGSFLAGLAGESESLEPPRGKWTNAGAVFGPQRAVAWRVLDAQYFGVAQRRRRVFVVASARKGFDPAAVLFESEGVRRDIAPSREAGEEAARGAARGARGGGPAVGVSPTLRAGGNKTGGDRPPGTDVDTADSLVITMAHGQGGAEIGFDRTPTLTCNHEAPIAAIPTTTHTLRGEGFDASEDGTGRGTPLVPHVVADAASTLDTAFGTKQGLEDQYVNAGCPVYGIPGNWIGRQPENGGNATAPMLDISPCLTSTDRHGVAAPALAVRRLIVEECEKLQGFPRGYTMIPWRNKPADQCPDGPRYKALGNSWAIPCVYWIGRRIQHEIAT